jgi:hypothetical protein
MFPVKYELGFYIPEDDILHSHRRENLKSHIVLGKIGGWNIIMFICRPEPGSVSRGGREQCYIETWTSGYR